MDRTSEMWFGVGWNSGSFDSSSPSDVEVGALMLWTRGCVRPQSSPSSSLRTSSSDVGYAPLPDREDLSVVTQAEGE